MILSLDVLPARKGDCLLLHYGTKDDPGLIVIDGGPAQVYKPHLKPRLERIRQARALGNNDRLPIDIVMVSHIDDDHINGILEMTKEIIAAGVQKPPLPVRALSVWHNSLEEILQDTPDVLVGAVTAQYGTASLSGDPETEGLDETAAMVLSSVAQGVQLRENLKKLKWSINREFDGALVRANAGMEPLTLDRGPTLHVVGPMEPELAALQREYAKFLRESEKKRKERELLAAFTDRSIPNLSSIVVLVELGGKTILLTGDARGDKILEGLEMMGLLKPGPGETLHVDIMKVPHHGSDRTLDPVFFRRVTADHYVFSGDGEHGNPERGTLEMLLDERPNERFTMHFTYPVSEIDNGRRKEWEKERNKQHGREEQAGRLADDDAGQTWSDEDQSIAALLRQRGLPDERRCIQEITGGAPHVIDLHEPLGY
jgi:hypothetical protein